MVKEWQRTSPGQTDDSTLNAIHACHSPLGILTFRESHLPAARAPHLFHFLCPTVWKEWSFPLLRFTVAQRKPCKDEDPLCLIPLT